jgi:hypothetical protein
MKGVKSNFRANPDLNKFLVLEHAKTETEHSQRQKECLGVPIIADRYSGTNALNPLEEMVYYENLSYFMNLINGHKSFTHNHNDISKFAKVPILSQGWASPTAEFFKFRGFTPTKDQQNPTGTDTVSKFVGLFGAVRFNKKTPILFDRQWRVIDGYNRLVACQHTNTKFYYLQLDF